MSHDPTRMEAALRLIAAMGPEQDEWDAAAKYGDCKEIAAWALGTDDTSLASLVAAQNEARN